MTQKELIQEQYHSSAENLREEQHNHLGDTKLRTYGYRFLGIAWG